MRKIILMGECTLDIVFPPTQNNYPLSTLSYLNAMPGGRLLNAAALLGTLHDSVTYVGEAARDRIGDMIVAFLESNNVNTKSIDRFVDGDTPSNLYFPVNEDHPTSSIMIYRRYPDDRFDVTWPRVDKDDIVVFGSYFALDPRVRPQLQELINYMIEREALIIYVPGFLQQQAPRITRVMPAILENLEVADIVVTRTKDLVNIYNEPDAAKCYEEHIKFYCRSYINVDKERRIMSFFHDDSMATTPISRPPISLMWHAGALAGIVSSIIDLGITREMLKTLPLSSLEDIITEANSMADDAMDKARIDHN